MVDGVIAIELGILIFLVFLMGSNAAEGNAAVQKIGPQLKRLEEKLDGIESALWNLRPKHDRNPTQLPD